MRIMRHGALATYYGRWSARTRLAGNSGIGAVAIRNSSHFGPAGAYAFDAAKRGFIGFAFCNSDSFVRLHDGAMRFHGTNPIACAVPVTGDNPWLFDMATSAVPYNRVQLYRSLGGQLPEGVASDERGYDTDRSRCGRYAGAARRRIRLQGRGACGIPEILSAVAHRHEAEFRYRSDARARIFRRRAASVPSSSRSIPTSFSRHRNLRRRHETLRRNLENVAGA